MQGAKNIKFNNFVIMNHTSASGYVVSLTFQHTQQAVQLDKLEQALQPTVKYGLLTDV